MIFGKKTTPDSTAEQTANLLENLVRELPYAQHLEDLPSLKALNKLLKSKKHVSASVAFVLQSEQSERIQTALIQLQALDTPPEVQDLVSHLVATISPEILDLPTYTVNTKPSDQSINDPEVLALQYKIVIKTRDDRQDFVLLTDTPPKTWNELSTLVQRLVSANDSGNRSNDMTVTRNQLRGRGKRIKFQQNPFGPDEATIELGQVIVTYIDEIDKGEKIMKKFA